MKKTTCDIPVIVVESPINSNDAVDRKTNQEDVDELQVFQNCTPSLRRNSISLPNLDDYDVQVITESHGEKISGNGNQSDAYNSEIDFSDIEEYNLDLQPRQDEVPLRNSRRKSITLSPRMLKPPGDEGSDSNSPANSITSINSLASLIREKMQMLPTTIKKKKPKDYKIRAFVGFLFLTIVFLVGLAYVLYHQKVLQRAYFDKIKFNKAKRVMKIYDDEGEVIVKGRLGTTLNYDKVHSCLHQDERHDGSICLEWMQRAKLYLYLYEMSPDIRCYNLKWMSLREDVEPTDCVDMTQDGGHWYGGGELAEAAWPLEKGGHDFAPFVTGRVDKQQWGNVLKRYFINSKGVAVIVDNATPLYVSIRDSENGKELCLKAKYDDFAFVNRQSPLPHLNYSICTGPNVTTLYSHMSEKSLWDGLRKDDITVMNSLLTEPLWQITSAANEDLTEESVANYTDKIINEKFLKQGHVLINEFWQKHIGDYTVDPGRFAELKEQIDIMHRRGFRVVFSVQPFISTESVNFAEAVKKKLLITERFSDRRIPALTRYKSLASAGMLDVTNERTIPWLLEKLKAVQDEYKLDSFYLDLGSAYDMPHYYQCEKTLLNPDEYKSIFVASIQGDLNLLGVNSAVQRPKDPTFVSLPMAETSWDGLRRVIPTALTFGIMGYPFLIPGAVGGDYIEQDFSKGSLPDRELYMRWLQLATFLPVIRFTDLHTLFKDDAVREMAEALTALRQSTVTPLLKKYATESLDSGLPIIRPLWMLDPNDQFCHTISDEFSIGEDLIVAPVLEPGKREREVYLPAGVWRDGSGSLRKGSRWIHNIKVPEDRIAYFERMPDDMRF